MSGPPPAEGITSRQRWPDDGEVTDTDVEEQYEDQIEEESLPGPTVSATLSVLKGCEVGQLHLVDGRGATLGRNEDCDITLSDASISRSHAKLVLHDGAFHIMDLGSSNGTFMDNGRVEGRVRLPSTCRLRLGGRTLLQVTSVDELGADAFERLRRALLMDPLTSTGNRTYLEQRMREETSYARRHQQTVGVLLGDLDHFKGVNDEFGHVVGDRFLQRVGRILGECVRMEDSVYRYGGEEFCVLVRGVSDGGLRVMAERIRAAVEAFRLPVGEHEVRLTISLGVANMIPGDADEYSTISAETDQESIVAGTEVILRADQALYLAKEGGRNRFVMYDDPHT